MTSPLVLEVYSKFVITNHLVQPNLQTGQMSDIWSDYIYYNGVVVVTNMLPGVQTYLHKID